MTDQPDDKTPTLVQIWLPRSAEGDQPNLANIRVSAPFCDDFGEIETQPGQKIVLTNSDGHDVAWLAYQYVGGSTGRGLVTLSINPTANLDRTGDLAPSGCRKLEIHRHHSMSQDPIHIRVCRDETLPGQQLGGRQAFFSNPDYKRFGHFGAPLAEDPPGATSPVRRSGTISGFACGRAPIVVAAYTEQSAELSPYSAAGGH